MSAFRAGHLRKAPVAAVKLVDGSEDGIRAALNLNTGYPLQITTLHASGVFLSSVTTDLGLTSEPFSYPSNFLYGGSP
jgi:hypothetical protein